MLMNTVKLPQIPYVFSTIVAVATRKTKRAQTLFVSEVISGKELKCSIRIFINIKWNFTSVNNDFLVLVHQYYIVQIRLHNRQHQENRYFLYTHQAYHPYE